MIENARLGLHRRTIAALVGVSLRTMQRLLNDAESALEKHNRGRRLTKREEEFCHFCREYRHAEIEPEITAVRVVVAAASEPGNWKAALAFLERRYPSRWAKRRIPWDAPFTMDEDEWPPRRKRQPKPAKRALYTRKELVAELQRLGLAAPDLRVVPGGRG